MPVLLVTSGSSDRLESCTEYADVCAASDAYDFMVDHCTEPMRVGLVNVDQMPGCILFTPMCYQDINGYEHPPERPAAARFFRSALN